MPHAFRPPHPALLVAITMTGPLALNIFVPSMPGLAAALGTDAGTAGLTLSLYLVGVAVAQLFYGPLSDRFGRRPVLLAGLAVYVAASLACAFADSIGALIAGRVAQAVGGCAGMVLTRAIVRDVYGRERSASVLGYITTAMAVAPAVAPALGGYLDGWFGWRAGFVLLVGFGAAVLAWSLGGLGETNREPQPLPGLRGMAAGYADLARRPVFMGYALNASLVSAAFFAFLSGAPFVMTEILGRTPAEYGLLFVVVSLGYMAGSFTAGHLGARVGPARLALVGSALAFAAVGALEVMALAGAVTPVTLFAPVAFMGLGNGISMPGAIAAAISANPRLAGTASGFLGFLQMALGAGATVAVTRSLAGSALPMTTIMLAASALGTLALALAHRGERVAAVATVTVPTAGASD